MDVFARGVIGGELRAGRPVAPGSPLVFGAGGLRYSRPTDALPGSERSRAALSLLAAAQRYRLPIDDSELQGVFRDAGDWLELVPEFAELLYQEGSLADPNRQSRAGSGSNASRAIDPSVGGTNR